MNKLRILLSGILLLITLLLCNQAAEALASGHHRKHSRTTASSEKQTSERGHSKHRSGTKSRYRASAAKHTAAKPRYAYPLGTFLMEAPAYDSSPLPEEISDQIRRAFYSGNAAEYPTRSLVRAGIAHSYPMRGGIYWRREPIKYLIMHSTEPGIPVGAKTIVDGWSHGGRRHAGAHYVIDRDGTIYQAVDPDLATVHINIFKTLPGINNDNAIGIEMCHQGSQDYPPALVESACRLAAYLQNHYHIAESNIITHRYAQQGDHTDPVNFAWDTFIAQKNVLQNQGLNQRLAMLKTTITNWQPIIEQPTIIVLDKKSKQTNKAASSKAPTATVVEAQPKPVVKPNVPALIEVQAKPLEKPVTPAVVEVQAKPVVKQPETAKAFEAPVPAVPKSEPKMQSAFEAKFGPIDKPVYDSSSDSKFTALDSADSQATPSVAPKTAKAIIETPVKAAPEMETVSSAPLPSLGTTAAPVAITQPSQPRLMPTPPPSRLVPFTMVINTQPNNSAAVSPANYAPTPNTARMAPAQTPERRSNRLLPLRGPIEMEPDEAPLLSQ